MLRSPGQDALGDFLPVCKLMEYWIFFTVALLTKNKQPILIKIQYSGFITSLWTYLGRGEGGGMVGAGRGGGGGVGDGPGLNCSNSFERCMCFSSGIRVRLLVTLKSVYLTY